MIQGDIDLTTNLDFYKDKSKKVKRSHKLIPWENKQSKNKVSNSNCLLVSNSNSRLQSITYTLRTQDGNLIDNNYPVYYFNDSTNRFSTAYNYFEPQWTTLNSSSGTINLYNTITEFFDDDYPYTTYSINSTLSNIYELILVDQNTNDTLLYASVKEQNPIFKKKPKDIKTSILNHIYCEHGKYSIGDCKYCKRKYKKESTNAYKAIRMSSLLKKYRLEDNNEHALDVLDILHRKKERNKKYGYRCRRKIPWLRGLNDHVYNDYIDELLSDEEKDYSHYLTDMGWLRIHQ